MITVTMTDYYNSFVAMFWKDLNKLLFMLTKSKFSGVL